jgi:Tfp pilus assembly protein PilN
MTIFDKSSKNEKFLLLILAAIIFVGGSYFGYRWLAQKQSSLQLAYLQLKADQAEAKVDLLESDKYAQRQAWIRDHEPTLGDEGETKAQVLEYVLKGARDNKLEIVEQSLNNVQHGPVGARVNVSVKVKGSMQDLAKWLTNLQKPDQFYAVSLFSLKADQDLKSMVCTLQIARYFKEGS